MKTETYVGSRMKEEKTSSFWRDELEGSGDEGKDELDVLGRGDGLRSPRRASCSEPARHLLQQLPDALKQRLHSRPLLLRVGTLHDADQALSEAPHHAEAFWDGDAAPSSSTSAYTSSTSSTTRE